MQQIYKRVSKWNGLRYEREYNHDLSMALLAEEFNEYFDTGEPVHKADALGDLIFVALGVLWKLNITEDNKMEYAAYEGSNIVQALVDTNTLMPIHFIGALITQAKHSADMPVEVCAHAIICAAMVQAQADGIDHDSMMKILEIICDSNDSKTIAKTASHIKANTDKGPFFISPEPRIQGVLNAIL